MSRGASVTSVPLTELGMDLARAVAPCYPPDWPQIARRVKDAADWRCRHCGHPHDWPRGYALTVHHLNRNKADCGLTNLLACCQRCHLHIQARYSPGQLMLPGLLWPWLDAHGQFVPDLTAPGTP